MNMTKEEKDELYHGKKRTKKELEALRRFAGPSLDRVAKINKIKKRREADARDRYLQERQGGKYEAMNRAGEAKSAADRERHMKLVLGDDWKPSDEGRLNRDRILAKMDKRNRALDPENDQGLLSGLRNKLGIMPTAAENERQIMAKNAAKREQARLSEGEAEGALAGSAAERIRQAREAREARLRKEERQKKRHEDYRKFSSGKEALETAQEPTTGGLDALGTKAFEKMQKRDARIKEYKGFTDEASLLARERAMRGESPIKEGFSSEEALKGALPFHRAAEREKHGGVGEKMLEERINREKGLMNIGSLPPSQRAKLESAEAGGERMDFDDPSIAGRTSWRGSSEERRKQKEAREGVSTTEAMREELGGKSVPFTKEMEEEMGGISLDLNDQDNRELLRGLDPEKAAALDMGDTELATARDDEARRLQRQSESGIEEVDFMANSSVEEQDEVIQKVSEDTDPFSEQTAAAKEDTGRFVRYDGASKDGIMIEKNKLKELFDRKRKMSYLQHVPQENRAALLYNWGLISHKDFTDTQKQSVKELLEIDKLRLQVGELQNKAPKMSDADKAQFTAAANGFQKAIEDRRWDEAQAFSDTLEQIIPGSQAKFNVETVQGKIDDGLKKLPALDKAKAQMGKQVFDGYFNFKNDLIKKIDLVKRSKEGSGDLERLLGATAQAGENKGKTWSDILEGQGVYSWGTVKKFKKGDAKELAKKLSGGKHEDITQIDRASYMGYVLPRIRLRMMENNYGKWHNMIEEGLHGAQKGQIKKHQQIINTNSQATAREVADTEEQTELNAIENAQERDNEIREAEAEELEVMEGVPPQITKLELLERLNRMRQLEKLKERNQKGSRGKGSYGRRGTFTN